MSKQRWIIELSWNKLKTQRTKLVQTKFTIIVINIKCWTWIALLLEPWFALRLFKQCRIQIVIWINHPNIDNHCIRNTLEVFFERSVIIYMSYTIHKRGLLIRIVWKLVFTNTSWFNRYLFNELWLWKSNYALYFILFLQSDEYIVFKKTFYHLMVMITIKNTIVIVIMIIIIINESEDFFFKMKVKHKLCGQV